MNSLGRVLAGNLITGQVVDESRRVFIHRFRADLKICRRVARAGTVSFALDDSVPYRHRRKKLQKRVLFRKSIDDCTNVDMA